MLKILEILYSILAYLRSLSIISIPLAHSSIAAYRMVAYLGLAIYGVWDPSALSLGIAGDEVDPWAFGVLAIGGLVDPIY